MYKYSERPKTLAERKYEDDIPEEVKQKRLEQIIELQHTHSLAINKEQIGKVLEVLAETESKRSSNRLMGRTDRNRSEEHTSELQSRPHLVCRLLLEKKKITK